MIVIDAVGANFFFFAEDLGAGFFPHGREIHRPRRMFLRQVAAILKFLAILIIAIAQTVQVVIDVI